MAVPVFAPGYTLAADDVNQWMVPLSSWKASPTSVKNTTAINPDPDLLLTFPQNGAWVIEAVIRYKGPSSANMAFQWQTSSPGIGGIYTASYVNSLGNLILENQLWTFTNSLAQTVGTAHLPEQAVRFHGLIIVGGAGSLSFTWGPDTVNGTTSTTVDTGSYLIGWRAG